MAEKDLNIENIASYLSQNNLKEIASLFYKNSDGNLILDQTDNIVVATALVQILMTTIIENEKVKIAQQNEQHKKEIKEMQAAFIEDVKKQQEVFKCELFTDLEKAQQAWQSNFFKKLETENRQHITMANEVNNDLKIILEATAKIGRGLERTQKNMEQYVEFYKNEIREQAERELEEQKKPLLLGLFHKK